MKVVVVNPLLLSDEEFQVIEDMAACNYSPKQIADYLSVDSPAKFCEYCLDGSSEISRRYQKGVLQSQFEINQKLLENAKKGNITAAQQFEKNSEAVRVRNLIDKYFG